MCYVYILECEDGSYYTGWCKDLDRRYLQHLNGKGAKYTKSHKPIRIIYSEKFKDKEDAMKREYEIKQMKRQEKENLIKLSQKKKKRK